MHQLQGGKKVFTPNLCRFVLFDNIILTFCVLNDFVQQQGVLGDPVHLRHQQVLQLQPPAVRTGLALLSE